MGLSTNLHSLDLRSTFFTGLRPCPSPIPSNFIKISSISNPRREIPTIKAQVSIISLETSVKERQDEIESLFSTSTTQQDFDRKRNGKNSKSGASGISSGVKLENIRKSYKGVTVLKDVTWEVKKGGKVGLMGVNGAGKTTQLRIITGQEEPNSGNVIKAKPDMKIAFLSQEFEVSMSKMVKEEFMSAFKEEMEITEKLERVHKAIEGSVDDLDLMGRLLDDLDLSVKEEFMIEGSVGFFKIEIGLVK